MNTVLNPYCAESDASTLFPRAFVRMSDGLVTCRAAEGNNPNPPNNTATRFTAQWWGGGAQSWYSSACQDIDLSAFGVEHFQLVAAGNGTAELAVHTARSSRSVVVEAYVYVFDGQNQAVQLVRSGHYRRTADPWNAFTPTMTTFVLPAGAETVRYCVHSMAWDYNTNNGRAAALSLVLGGSQTGAYCDSTAISLPFHQFFDIPDEKPVSLTGELSSSSAAVPARHRTMGCAGHQGMWYGFRGFNTRVTVEVCITNATGAAQGADAGIQITSFPGRRNSLLDCAEDVSCDSYDTVLTSDDVGCRWLFFFAKEVEYLVLVSSTVALSTPQDRFAYTIEVRSDGPVGMNPSLLYNGDFEEEMLHNGAIPGWTTKETATLCRWRFADSDDSGAQSVVPLGFNGTRTCGLYQDVALDPFVDDIAAGGQRLKLGAYMRRGNFGGMVLTFFDRRPAPPERSALRRPFVEDDDTLSWPNHWPPAREPVRSDGMGNPIGQSVVTGLRRNSDWVRYSQSVAIPRGARYVRLELLAHSWFSEGSPSVQFDSMSLEMEAEQPALSCARARSVSHPQSVNYAVVHNKTMGITPSALRSCNASTYQAGWFKVQGTGRPATITVHATDDFDGSLVVTAKACDGVTSAADIPCIALIAAGQSAVVHLELFKDYEFLFTMDSPPAGDTTELRFDLVHASADAVFDTNLVQNPNGNDYIEGDSEFPFWYGVGWSRSKSGAFYPGAGKYAELLQVVDVSAFASLIDFGAQGFAVAVSQNCVSYGSWDQGFLTLEFRDEQDALLGFETTQACGRTPTVDPKDSVFAPPLTRSIGVRYSAVHYDSFHNGFIASLGHVSLQAMRPVDGVVCASGFDMEVDTAAGTDSSAAAFAFSASVPCDSGVQATRAVWFSYTPQLARTQVQFSVCTNASAAINMRLARLHGSCAAMTCDEITDSSSVVPTCASGQRLSMLMRVEGARTYRFVVFGTGDGAEGGAVQATIGYKCGTNWNAQCSDCKPGFFGPSCAQSCLHCPGECLDGVTGDGSCVCSGAAGCNVPSKCDAASGEMIGSWDVASNCTECADRAFGPDCGSTCSNCAYSCDDGVAGDGTCFCLGGGDCNTAAKCDNQTGQVVGAWDTALNCSTCRSNWYGEGCANHCTSCKYGCDAGPTADGACHCFKENVCREHGKCTDTGSCQCVDEYFYGELCDNDARQEALAAGVGIGIFVLVVAGLSARVAWKRHGHDGDTGGEGVGGADLKFNTANVMAAIMMLVSVLQLCAFSFSRTFPWHSSADGPIDLARFTLFDYTENKFALAFYASCVLAVGFSMTVLPFHLRSSSLIGPDRRPSGGCALILFVVAEFFVLTTTIFWAAIVQTLLRGVDCTYRVNNGQSPFMDAHPDTKCWSSEHNEYVAMASIAFAVFIPASFLTIPAVKEHFQEELQLRIASKFTMATMAVELLLSCMSVFLGDYQLPHAIGLVVATAALLLLNISLSPVHNRPSVNRWRSVGFVVALWCAVCAVLTVIVDDKDSVGPAALLLLGVGAFVVLGVLVQMGVLKPPAEWADRFTYALHGKSKDSEAEIEGNEMSETHYTRL